MRIVVGGTVGEGPHGDRPRGILSPFSQRRDPSARGGRKVIYVETPEPTEQEIEERAWKRIAEQKQNGFDDEVS